MNKINNATRELVEYEKNLEPQMTIGRSTFKTNNI